MPTVFRFNVIRFHFFANEGIPREPIYIHAERSDADAKLWLYREVTIAKTFGYNRSEQTVLLRIVLQRRTEIERAWNEFFSQGS